MRFFGLSLPAFGAFAALVFTLGFMFLGPVDVFRIPTPQWVRCLLLPGIWVGFAVNDLLRWPILACQAAGVCAMAEAGGFVGFLGQWIAAAVRVKR